MFGLFRCLLLLIVCFGLVAVCCGCGFGLNCRLCWLGWSAVFVLFWFVRLVGVGGVLGACFA